MSNQNPATPGANDQGGQQQTATPGSNEQNQNQNSDSGQNASAAQGQGNSNQNKEESVQIPLKEYRNLQRNNARLQSIQKRNALRKKDNSSSGNDNSNDGMDPQIAEELDNERTARLAAERRAYELEVKEGVRDLLQSSEFKDLPLSTKNLILKNPAAYSNADSVDEALLDIEDFVREQVVEMNNYTPSNSNSSNQQPNQSQNQGNQPQNQGQQGNQNPQGHDTPVSVNQGAPADPSEAGLEDVSKLSGPARSRAALRNAIKKSRK